MRHPRSDIIILEGILFGGTQEALLLVANNTPLPPNQVLGATALCLRSTLAARGGPKTPFAPPLHVSVGAVRNPNLDAVRPARFKRPPEPRITLAHRKHDANKPRRRAVDSRVVAETSVCSHRDSIPLERSS